MKRKVPLQRKTPLRRNPNAVKALKRTPIKRTGPPNKVSKKLAEDRRLYAIEAKAFLIDHPFCEANVTEICTKEHPRPSMSVHHKRGRIGKLLRDKRYFLAVCDGIGGCHRVVELNPKLAKELNLSQSRLAKT